MPVHALAAEHDVVRLGDGAGAAQRFERRLHRRTLKRCSLCTLVGSSFGDVDGDDPAAAAVRGDRVAAWRSVVRLIAAAAPRRTPWPRSRRRRRPPSRAGPARARPPSSTAKRDLAAHERPRPARPSRSGWSATSPTVPPWLHVRSTSGRGDPVAWSVRHRSTLDVNVQRVDFARCAARARRRRPAAGARRGRQAGWRAGRPTPAMRAGLWWIVGLAQRALGDLARRAGDVRGARIARRRRRRRRAAGPDHASASPSRSATRRRPPRRPRAARRRPSPTSTTATAPCCSIQRGILRYRLGRLDDAVAERSAPAQAGGRAGDRLHELKALVNLGAFESQHGALDDARDALLEAVTLAGEHDQISLGRHRARQPRLRRDRRGQPARGARRLRRRRGRLPPHGTTADLPRAATPTTPSPSPTPTCSTTPST